MREDVTQTEWQRQSQRMISWSDYPTHRLVKTTIWTCSSCLGGQGVKQVRTQSPS